MESLCLFLIETLIPNNYVRVLLFVRACSNEEKKLDIIKDLIKKYINGNEPNESMKKEILQEVDKLCLK